MKTLAISVLLACAGSPAPAQPAPPAAQEQPDPARLAAAEKVAAKLLPPGSYGRMIEGSMDQVMDSVMTSLLDMDVSVIAEMLTEEERAEIDPAALQTSMREVMEASDPHFAERLMITNRTIWAEMTPILSTMEPHVRAALAAALARRFDTAALAELDRFFATPVGSAYAAESVMIWMDPEMATAVTAAMPEMMKHMPAIMTKVEAATAHLPPEPDPEAVKEAVLQVARN